MLVSFWQAERKTTISFRQAVRKDLKWQLEASLCMAAAPGVGPTDATELPASQPSLPTGQGRSQAVKTRQRGDEANEAS